MEEMAEPGLDDPELQERRGRRGETVRHMDYGCDT